MNANINCDKLLIQLVKFEKEVKNYGDFSADPRALKKLDDLKSEFESQSRKDKIKNAGKVIETAIYALDDLKSGNSTRVMKGSLSIISSVAVLVGGPYGIAASAICGVLGAILSANSSDTEPDLATVFAQKVRVELLKFKQDTQLKVLSGLQKRMAIMIKNLKLLDPVMPDSAKNDQLPDKPLYERDFPQFIAEVSKDITKSLSTADAKEDIDACITAMVVYCNAQMSLMLLLANVIFTFEATGRVTKFIKTYLNDQKEDAHKKLGFLSDEKYLSPAGLLPFGGGKLLKIYHLQSSLLSSVIVDEFRQEMGMTRMPTFQSIKKEMDKAKKFSIQWVSDKKSKYPHPETKQDHHYFQLINHTRFPIKVVCGTAGDKINGLDFRRDIDPYTSYERVASESTRFFSAGGYFIIYADGKKRTFEKRFDDKRGLKVFEFALSNPSTAYRKQAILEKTKLDNLTGKDCWDGMKDDKVPTQYFAHDKSYFAVGGQITKSPLFIPALQNVLPKEINDSPFVDAANAIFGIVIFNNPLVHEVLPNSLKPVTNVTDTNFSRTWHFIVQEFNIDSGEPVTPTDK